MRKSAQNACRHCTTGRLILVRHAKSIDDLAGIFDGSRDTPLVPESRRHAAAARVILSRYRIDEVFSTEKKRALQTAKIICPRHRITICRELAGRETGILNGLTKAQATEVYGQEQMIEWRYTFKGKPPEGQSLYDIWREVRGIYQKEIKPKILQAKTVLVVLHGASLVCMHRIIRKLDDNGTLEVKAKHSRPNVFTFSIRDGRARLQKLEVFKPSDVMR